MNALNALSVPSGYGPGHSFCCRMAMDVRLISYTFVVPWRVVTPHCKDMYGDRFVNLKLLQPGVFPMLIPSDVDLAATPKL